MFFFFFVSFLLQEQHIREDLDLEGFQLSPQDLAQLTAAEMPPRFTRWRNCNQGCAA